MPHRMRQFKLSNDPRFIAEVRDGSVKNLGRYAAIWLAGRPKRPSSTRP